MEVESVYRVKERQDYAVYGLRPYGGRRDQDDGKHYSKELIHSGLRRWEALSIAKGVYWCGVPVWVQQIHKVDGKIEIVNATTDERPLIRRTI